ncbi:MAG: cyclic nucleotide-binding domain-containing protein [Bacteroidetes bacterium]|jgi:CRP-like cAMP-binding protein|nr:cyclic nucleotide-binding domain-containing protein [Bacteroidota bacterium]
MESSRFLLSVFTLCGEGSLSRTTVAEMKSRFKIRTYKKGAVICSPENGKANKISFLRKGLVRGVVKIQGKEITNWITMENELFASANFFSEHLFIEHVESIEDVTIEYLDQDDFKFLLNFADFRSVGQKLLTEYYVWANRRALIARIPNSRARLEFFLKNYNNDIIDRCPDKYLAEFLGIRPETMSRILREVRYFDKYTISKLQS